MAAHANGRTHHKPLLSGAMLTITCVSHAYANCHGGCPPPPARLTLTSRLFSAAVHRPTHKEALCCCLHRHNTHLPFIDPLSLPVAINTCSGGRGVVGKCCCPERCSGGIRLLSLKARVHQTPVCPHACYNANDIPLVAKPVLLR